MRIHPFDQAPILPEDVVFRPSRIWMLLGVVICGGMTAITFFLPGWIGWIGAAFCLLIMFWVAWRTAATLSPASWVLRYNGRRVLIKIGPPSSHDATRVFVAEFPAPEIQWVRSFQQVITTRNAANEIESNSTTWMELKPRDADFDELQSCLKTAATPRQWHGWSVTTSIPVSLTGDGIVRVAWQSQNLVLAPSLKRTLRLLGNEIPVQPKVTELNDFTKSDADQAKMEQQIVDCVAQGQILQATKLARQRYGYSLTEARQFVAELQGKDDAALPLACDAKNGALNE